jgi:hypothetical protein
MSPLSPRIVIGGGREQGQPSLLSVAALAATALPYSVHARAATISRIAPGYAAVARGPWINQEPIEPVSVMVKRPVAGRANRSVHSMASAMISAQLTTTAPQDG